MTSRILSSAHLLKGKNLENEKKKSEILRQKSEVRQSFNMKKMGINLKT